MAWVHQVINRMRGGTSEEAARDLAQQGIDVIVGEAAFLSPHELIIADTSLNAESVIIATGCQNVVPSIAGLNDVGYISNVEAVALPALPRNLAVVGGGAIGIEFAQCFPSVKLLADKRGHILAPNAGDLLAPVILAMRVGLTVETLAATIMPYPTLVEGVRWAAYTFKTRPSARCASLRKSYSEHIIRSQSSLLRGVSCKASF